MCDYCGCQSLAVIAELTEEHDRLRDLGRALTDAAHDADHAAAAAVARRMLDILEPHTSVEEHGLFPAMTGDFPSQIHGLQQEHECIDATLRSIADGSLGRWRAAANGAVAQLFDHILKEQDGVFPAALATLTSAQWERVAESRMALASSARLR